MFPIYVLRSYLGWYERKDHVRPWLWLKLCELVVALHHGVVAADLLPLRRDVLPLSPLRQLRRFEHVRVSVSLDLSEFPANHAVHALRTVPPLNQPSVKQKMIKPFPKDL